MDSITYNKLEYITSGSGLTPNELNEIVDLMDEYARTHVTEALRKHVVVRGGDSENQFVQHVNKYFKVAYLDKTANTPTEPLDTEAQDTVAERGLCENECTGPWDCKCQDVLKEYYSGGRKSSEEQL